LSSISNIFAVPFIPFTSRFCFERGCALQSNNNGDYGKLHHYAIRPNGESWPEDMEPLPVSDWHCFRDIWKRNLPKLRIRNACEDTCPECFILKNKFKYLGRRRQDEDEVSLPDDAELPKNITADESLLFNENLHAEQARQQRNLAADRQHEPL
jgi:hypothetical protein